MFTGIVCETGRIVQKKTMPGLLAYAVAVNSSFLTHLQKGASVSVDGICQTVVDFDQTHIWFDAIDETLKRTTLASLSENSLVNLERSARFGDEIGGHILSGHVFGTATISTIDVAKNNWIIHCRCPQELVKYLFPKGYVALNGVSLTLVDVDKTSGIFSVHLIPETLKRTTFGMKKVGDRINIEVDAHTQTVVDTLEHIYASRSTS